MSQENSLQSNDMNDSGDNEAAQEDEKQQSLEGQSSFENSLQPGGSSSSSQPLETYQQNITPCDATLANPPEHSKIDIAQIKDKNIRGTSEKRGSQESNISSSRSSWSEGFEKPSYYKNSANWSLSQWPQSELEKHFRSKGEKSILGKQRLSLKKMKKQETEDEKDMSKMWVLFSIFEMQLNQQEAEKFLAGKQIENKEIVLQETVEFCLQQAEKKYQLWQFNHSQEKQASEYYIFPELFSRKQDNQRQSSSSSSVPVKPKYKQNLNDSATLNKQLLTQDGSVCPICFYAVNSEIFVHSSDKCNHFFCKECLFKYVSFCINNSRITASGVICPNEGCSVMLTLQEIAELLQSNQKLIQNYSRLKCLAQAKQSNILMECIKPNCKGLMQINADSICLFCPICKSETCLRCHQAWHNGMKCSDALMFKYSEIRKDEVRCPHCLRDVRQTSNQVKSDSIECTWCYFKFCKLCGQKATLFHYSQLNCCFKCNEKEFKTISFSSVVKSSCKYLCLFLFTLVLYPIYLIGMALTFPLVTYFSRHNSSFGDFKIPKIIGLLVLGVIFFPFWFIFSIAPGTCIFISRTKKNILKRDPSDNGDPSN